MVALGLAAESLVMLFGPRDLDEFAAVWWLVQENYAFAASA